MFKIENIKPFNSIKLHADTNEDILVLYNNQAERMWPYLVSGPDIQDCVVIADSPRRALVQVAPTENREKYSAKRIALKIQGWGELSTENF